MTIDVCAHISSELLERAGSLEGFTTIVKNAVEGAIGHILDKRISIEDLQSNEKSHFGAAFERRFIEMLGLPPNQQGLLLDTMVAGVNVDIKCTLGHNNWCIPPEGHNQWMIVLRVDYLDTVTFDCGVVFADATLLNSGTNRDEKVGLNKTGVKGVVWLLEDIPFAYHGNYHHAAKLPKPKTPGKKRPQSSWLPIWDAEQKGEIIQPKYTKKKTIKGKIAA